MRRSLLAVLCMLPLAGQAATPLVHDEVRFAVRMMGAPVEGVFRRVSAQLVFEPAAPQKSQANITIDLNSAELGSDEATAEVKQRDWFDTATYPSARFVSSAVHRLADGTYEVSGRMTLKGRSHDLTVPFRVQTAGQARIFSGSFVLHRLDYAVGSGEWADTSSVGNDVTVRFRFSQPLSNP